MGCFSATFFAIASNRLQHFISNDADEPKWLMMLIVKVMIVTLVMIATVRQ